MTRWAKITRKGTHRLRRGAWYAVADDSRLDVVVVIDNRRRTEVGRDCVELADRRPMLWSVVVRDADEGTAIPSGQAQLRCPRCDIVFGVDWG